MANTELKPCPFCGGMADFEKEHFGTKSYIWIECTKCSARIARVAEALDYCAKDKAIKIWNERVDNNEKN